MDHPGKSGKGGGMSECERIRPRLSSWARRELPAEWTGPVQAHLAECITCRRLAQALQTALSALDEERELTAAILAATSGSACHACRMRLEAIDRGTLSRGEEMLVREHLDHCAACRAVRETLAWLPAALEDRRERSGGPSFVTGVLDRTVGTPSRRARRFGRLAQGWRVWSRRPLFALEAAYLATVVLIVLVGPATLARAPERAVSWVRSEETGLQMAGSPLEGLRAPGDWTGTGALSRKVMDLSAYPRRVLDGIEARTRAPVAALRAIAEGMRAFAAALFDGRGDVLGPALRQVGEGFTRLWKPEDAADSNPASHRMEKPGRLDRPQPKESP